MKIIPKEMPLGKLHQYLLGSIAPRPIALVSTISKEGLPNLSPFSFFNIFSTNPPMVIFSPARRGRDNTTKHTYENAKEIAECVINIVNFDIVEQCNLSSTEYAKGVNEFIKSGLSPVSSDFVRPFRVKESPVQLECLIKQVIELGYEGGAGNLILAEVVCMHIKDEILDETQNIDPHKIDLVGRMGGEWYCRASGSGIFEIEKPNSKLGIGIDQIPSDIRNSVILSGNDLGKLGNCAELPNETDVNEYKLIELSELFIQHDKDSVSLQHALHLKAKTLLGKGLVLDAWKTLLAYNG